MLMHHTDIHGGGIVGRELLDLLSTDIDLSFIRFIHTEQDTHKRRFSGAVFTQESKDLTFPDAD